MPTARRGMRKRENLSINHHLIHEEANEAKAVINHSIFKWKKEEKEAKAEFCVNREKANN